MSVLSDPGMTEQFFKPVFVQDTVVSFQCGAKQGFAKSSGTQEDRIIHSLQFGNVMRLVHKIAIFADNGLIIGLGVQDAFFHVRYLPWRLAPEPVGCNGPDRHLCLSDHNRDGCSDKDFDSGLVRNGLPGFLQDFDSDGCSGPVFRMQ